MAPFLIKGKEVFVEGGPDIRQYTKNDGTPGVTMTLRVSNLQLVGGVEKPGGTAPAQNAGTSQAMPAANNYTASAPAPSDVDDSMDDLPF